MVNEYTQSGRSMIEIMGYMIVSMFLIAGVAKIVSGAYNNYKISQASMQISDLAGTIVKASAADSNYGEVVDIINNNITDDDMKALKLKERKNFIPKSYRVVGDKIYNVFGSEVQVSIPSSDDDVGTRGDQFAIQFLGLDREQCIEMMSKEWINNSVVDLYAIVLNSTNYWFWPVYHPVAANNEHALPVKMIDIAGDGDSNEGLCGSDNNIMWVFN